MFFTIGSLVYSAYIAANSTGELKTVNSLCQFYNNVHVLQKDIHHTSKTQSHLISCIVGSERFTFLEGT